MFVHVFNKYIILMYVVQTYIGRYIQEMSTQYQLAEAFYMDRTLLDFYARKLTFPAGLIEEIRDPADGIRSSA